MAFVLVQLRPVGDKRGSYYLRRSDEPRDSTFRRLDDATGTIRRLGDTAEQLLVIIYDHRDRADRIYAVKHNHWRQLPMINHP